MEYKILGIDLAKGPDKTAYVYSNKETGKIGKVEIIKNQVGRENR